MKKVITHILIWTMLLSCISITGCKKVDVSDIASGKYISDIYTDKAAYQPGENAALICEITNPNTKKIKAHLKYTVKKLGETIDVFQTDAEVEASGSKEIKSSWTVPDKDFTGYAVETELYIGQKLIDYDMTAIDVSSDWNVFPRYAYLTKYGQRSEEETTEILNNLLKYHINGLFYYDHLDRHDKPLAGTVDNPDEKWRNLAQTDTYKSTIDDLIRIGHSMNMKSFSYNLIFGAYADYGKIGVQKEWGLFKDNTHTQQDFYPLPNMWETSKLYLMDPGNTGWQDYYIQRCRDLLSIFDFDGIQVDSVGARQYTIYDYNGNVVQLDKRYSGMLSRLKSEIGKKIIFNAVSGYGQEDVAANVDLDIMFTEVWPNSNKTYNTLKDAVDTDNRLGGGRKGVVIPAYMDYKRHSQIGEFGTPGILYTDAAIISSGGDHLELGDTGMLSCEYYPGKTLSMSDDLTKALRNYYTFMTAYENLLRGGGFNEQIRRTYFNDDICSTNASKGEVWSFTKVNESANCEVLNLINLKDVNSTEWVDNKGDQPAPTVIDKPLIRQYVKQDISSVKFASPDYEQGYMQSLQFTQNEDSKGKYIEFTIPSLEYWSMVMISY